MNVYPLIEKLIEIERALTRCDIRTVRRLLVDAEEFALSLQKEAVDLHRVEEKSSLENEI